MAAEWRRARRQLAGAVAVAALVFGRCCHRAWSGPSAPAVRGPRSRLGHRLGLTRRSADGTDTFTRIGDELEELLGQFKESKSDVATAEVVAPAASGAGAGEADDTFNTALAPATDPIYKSVGLRPAPAEYGEGMFVASSAQIEQIVDFKLQKVQASMNALKRYTKELEAELEEREEELDKVFNDLQTEQDARKAVEQERDQLAEQRLILEAKMVEDQQVQQDAEKEVQEMDRKAEEVAEALARGEITEDEAMRIEEELIRAQAKRLAAQQVQERNSKEMEELKASAEEAVARAEKAGADAERLQQQLEALQAEVARARDEKQAESRLKEEAEVKFKSLVQRLQAKAAEE